jgi:RpiR family carbohydrate utilization transcriptional regulator
VVGYETDIVSRISEVYGHLRDAEQKVAQMVLDDIEFAAHASIKELAARAQVSEATITRFAKAVDCKNVRDLKLRLAQSLAIGLRFYNESLHSEGKVEPAPIYGVYENIKSTLDHNAKFITANVIDPVVEQLSRARQTLIFGVGGGSTVIAQECQHRLFRLGLAATAYSDPMLMRMAAAAIDSSDVVICLSLGGFSPDVQQAAEIAGEYGAKTVAITAVDSPLAKAVDLVIPIETLETDFIFKPTASRYAMLAAIDVVVTELAVKHKRKSREKLRRLKYVLDHHRRGKNRLPLGD